MANHQSDSYGPDYYKRGKTQVWDFIRDNNLNFHLGNAIKYIARAGYKDSKEEDLKKAIHYLENELQHTQSTNTGQGVSEVVPYPQLKDCVTKIGTERADNRRV